MWSHVHQGVDIWSFVRFDPTRRTGFEDSACYNVARMMVIDVPDAILLVVVWRFFVPGIHRPKLALEKDGLATSFNGVNRASARSPTNVARLQKHCGTDFGPTFSSGDDKEKVLYAF